VKAPGEGGTEQLQPAHDIWVIVPTAAAANNIRKVLQINIVLTSPFEGTFRGRDEPGG